MTDKRGVRLAAALGSSFAAGPGLPPTEDRAAMRSGANYAHILAERLGASLVDLTVSGATTATVLHDRQWTLTSRFDPQLAGVPANADLVTITAGGNDLKFIGSLVKAAITSRLKRHVLLRPVGALLGRAETREATDSDIERAAAGLSAIVDGVRTRAPGAKVILVDYLTVLGPDSAKGTGVPFTDQEIDVFTKTQAGLQAAFMTAAAESGADLVQASSLSRDHGLGSAEPWVFGYRGPRRLGATFHPNQLGMNAIAEELYSRITQA